ncbi:hypothetical protein EJ04DRAFT_71148 [Polyplosphaeria fusca]|uniref:Uncharacterized protein n=1 Tax=Polyplosphaeria fusca TaxID=682080 RepID=A0A9P4V654_9PLEO|nr:hypothetical protein EJ04DRAFT_71148 [Polyplosphaeria fusca]
MTASRSPSAESAGPVCERGSHIRLAAFNHVAVAVAGGCLRYASDFMLMLMLADHTIVHLSPPYIISPVHTRPQPTTHIAFTPPPASPSRHHLAPALLPAVMRPLPARP